MNVRPIIFVGGLHRSGTSLLATLLAEHPDVGNITNTSVIEGEGQYLQDVLPLEQDHGGPGRFAFYREYHKAPAELSGQELAERLRDAWDPYWPSDTKYVLEKTPGNLLRVQLLRQVFPSARFVFIIRHPVATALATQKWSHTGLFELIYHWLVAYESLEDVAESAAPFVLLSYEDLMNNPEGVAEKIYTFLGLEQVSTHKLHFTERNKSYFNRWRMICGRRAARKAPPNHALVYNFMHRLKVGAKAAAASRGYQVSILRSEAADAIAAFEERVNARGYSLTDLGRYPAVRMEPSCPRLK